MSTRRDFLKTTALAGAGLAATSFMRAAEKAPIVAPQRKRTPSKDGRIRVGFIGCGFRSQEHFNNVLSFLDTRVVAICDISDFSLNMTKETFKKKGKELPKIYQGSEHEYENMLKNEEFDVVLIASPWEWHVPMSVAAMKAGVPYVGVEVSAANTMDECWDLVNTSEEPVRNS